MEDSKTETDEFVQLARLALVGRSQDLQTFIHRVARRRRNSHPEFSTNLHQLLQEAPSAHSPLRRESPAPLPVDQESRLQLLRVDQNPSIEIEPIWDTSTKAALEQVVSERSRIAELNQEGLLPTRSLIFTGPPGVGKSLAARWVAKQLKRPLLTLDLSAVMSSYLGRTGANVRHVLNYAKEVECVLLLDELDAIAKRRDDATDVGELKRLVTVLLQEIDDWPSSGLLIAATNHADLLDPAVWRRFEVRVTFPMPNETELKLAVDSFLGKHLPDPRWRKVLVNVLRGLSFSDVEREITQARRMSIVQQQSLEATICKIIHNRISLLSKADRIATAIGLQQVGISQRQVQELTGVSRDTIRKRGASTTPSDLNPAN